MMMADSESLEDCKSECQEAQHHNSATSNDVTPIGKFQIRNCIMRLNVLAILKMPYACMSLPAGMVD